MLSELDVQWKFISSRSFHFGGLWKAVEKSIKGHM